MMQDCILCLIFQHMQLSGSTTKSNLLLKANETFPIARIPSIDQGQHKSITSDSAYGLVSTLYLWRGVRVMITFNSNVTYGLFNCSNHLFKWQVSRGSPTIYCYGKRNKVYKPPFINSHPQLVLIVPVERKEDCHCFSQGMSIGEGEANCYIGIHPGDKKF